METYNYYEAVKRDVKNVIGEYDIDYSQDIATTYSELYDELWTNDSVTGNGSGSYTFNRYQAEEYLAHNLSLAEEALDYFDSEIKLDAEYLDVTIRCYLLANALKEVLEDMYKRFGTMDELYDIYEEYGHIDTLDYYLEE